VHDRVFAELGLTPPARDAVSSGTPVTEDA